LGLGSTLYTPTRYKPSLGLVSGHPWPPTVGLVKSATRLDTLTQVNRHIRARYRNIVLKPAGSNGFGLGIETHRLLTISMLITIERAFPAGKREERQWHRNRNVNPYLT